MAAGHTVEAARDAFNRRAWSQARVAFASARGEGTLSLDDIERLAVASHLVGMDQESREALAEGYREALRLNDVSRAARFAFWIGHGLIFTGGAAEGAGWFARARTALSERGADCVEWGYLLIPTGIERLLSDGDAAGACQAFTEAQAIARRFGDPDLEALAGHGKGRALIAMGLRGEGLATLDEVMVAVTSGEIAPMVVGDLYCGVIEACHDLFDVHRAREWTAALTRWCDDQPDLVPYRGPCLVHRVELMRLRGDWEDALAEARRACEWLSLPASPEGPGDAFYQLGELHRLRGDFPAADEAYRQANRLGRLPEPGLSLLWLALGRTEAAHTALLRALEETDDRARRSELLAAHVEVRLSLGDIEGAREAARELAEIATAVDAVPLHALAERAAGSVHIAEGEARAAIAPLRRAWSAWNSIDAPYEAARVRVLIGAACRALGDAESAAMEDDAARWVFERLGAAPDLARLQPDPPREASGDAADRLTPRELEVLALIAAGGTNRSIAAALVISEHTVARHVQNMLTKLGFSSRTSLATYAVEQGLTRPPR